MRFSSGAFEQKVPGFVMRAEETFHFAPERGVTDALRRHEFVAGSAGWQFDCPGEHIFGAVGGLVHRARKPAMTLTSAPASASAKNLIPFVRQFRFVFVTGRKRNRLNAKMNRNHQRKSVP